MKHSWQNANVQRARKRFSRSYYSILITSRRSTILTDMHRSALVTDVVLKRRKVTGSFGVASYPRHGKTPQKIVEAADEQMYVSKQAGGNRVSCAKSPS